MTLIPWFGDKSRKVVGKHAEPAMKRGNWITKPGYPAVASTSPCWHDNFPIPCIEHAFRKHPMVSNDELKIVIAALLREQIKSAEILNVIVARRESYDGDEVLDIKVIYNSPSKRLDPNETIAMIGLVRSALHERGEEAFPLLRYIVKSEAGKLLAAA